MNLFWQVIHLSNNFHILPQCVREERSPIFLRLGMIRTQAPGSRHQHDENNIKVYYDREIRYFLCKKVLKVILYVPKYLLTYVLHTYYKQFKYLPRTILCALQCQIMYLNICSISFSNSNLYTYWRQAGLNYNNKIIN